jgi:2-polyprenyl-6-methoxyphenol hydroxylase-like FAD-dependent oxidoreductase
MPLKVLIVGAGVAGPALASLLQGSDPSRNITVVERFPSLRTAGQQIDLKNQAVPILKRMGVFETMKAHCVNETGLEIMNTHDQVIAQFGISPSGQRRRTLTSEYELIRGDVVKVLYEASLKQHEKLKEELGNKGPLTYEFGNTVEELSQDNSGVDVTFSNGKKERYDLVVAADGQSSRTRRLAFGSKENDAAFRSLGVHAAYYSMPRVEGEGSLAKAYMALGSRMIVTRNSDRPMTQVLLFTMKDVEKLQSACKGSLEKQKEAFAENFRDAGWQTSRLLNGMATSKDFYAHEMGQIKMQQLYKERVVLLGDAGYCPTPFTGMGVTGCLIGAYVLAGELTRHGNDVGGALKAYDEVMRKPIDECQQMSLRSMGFVFPSSQLGLWTLRSVLWVASKLEPYAYRGQTQDDPYWSLPDYPELNLKPDVAL